MSSEYLAKDIRCPRLSIHEELGAPPTMGKGTKWQSRLYAEVLRFPRDIPPATFLRLGKKISFSGHAGETKEARPIKGANDFWHYYQTPPTSPVRCLRGLLVLPRAFRLLDARVPRISWGGDGRTSCGLRSFCGLKGIWTRENYVSFRRAGRSMVNVVKFR